MKKGFLDASSAILLHKSGLFQFLLDTYRIIMAESVYKELSCDGYPGARTFSRCSRDGRLIVCETPKPEWVAQQTYSRDTSSLHQGERDTIRCFDAGPRSFIITDDGKAARICRDENIPYINALLFPKILFLASKLSRDDCCRKTEMLLCLGRYSPAVIAFAEKCTQDDLQYFLP